MSELEFVRHGRLLVPAGLMADLAAAAAEDGEVPGTDLEPRPAAGLEPVAGEPELVDPDGEVQDGEVVEGEADGPLGWGPLGWLRRRTAAVVESAEVLYGRLQADRAVIEVGRDDELARRIAAAEHQMALDGVDEQVAAVRRERAERARNAAEAERLAALYRHTASAGERARIAAEISRTGEMRALRIAKLQKVGVGSGLIALVGFGIWSTAGVHGGLVKLMSLGPWSAGWIAGWAVEPLLILIVAGLIVARAVLKMSGGDVDRRAKVLEGGALGTSIGLNMFGGWPEQAVSVSTALGTAMAHSVGAIFAALTAWAIGVLIDYTTRADPWTGAPRIADLGLNPSGTPAGRPSGTSSAAAAGRTPGTAIRRGKRAPVPIDRTGLPEEMQKLLDAVRAAITEGLLPADPSAYAIYKQVMGGRGDRARSTEAAALVAGWRPPLHVVGDTRATG